MIEPGLKRVIGQMTYGVYVVAARSGSVTRAFTSTWTYQLSFEEPVLAVSVSPKHDTYPLIVEGGRFTASILAGDQIEQAQYFSYPGHRFRHVGDYLVDVDGSSVVDGCIGWLDCRVFDRVQLRDHALFMAQVERVGEGRLGEPALTYSSRKGWRVADTPARTEGESVRDRLLAMLDERSPDPPNSF
jgi:flavin reductase (DIM6/NTAB) family NADH-FMN oxidoreductase RutF